MNKQMNESEARGEVIERSYKELTGLTFKIIEENILKGKFICGKH